MGFLDHFSQHSSDHDQVESAGHKASISHELLGGAAAFSAAKAYEAHVAANGKPTSHAKAKELMAGFSGAFVDRVVETKGLDFVDREKAKHEAKKRGDKGLNDSGEY